MASLVERLRVRSDRSPIYIIDESDDVSDLVKKKFPSGISSENIGRPDAVGLNSEGSCQSCGKDENNLICETCTYAYHSKCLLPPIKGPLPSSWNCPECVGSFNEIEKILDCAMRLRAADDSDAFKLGSGEVILVLAELS